jgi:hypothetical protein
MKIETKDFVIARPGYNEKYKKDVTWEELKRTFLLYKRIPMIVAGGDHYGTIDPNNAIGFVEAKIDEDAQTIRGDDPVFYNEKFDTIPAELQRKLAHKEFIHASLGYEPYDNIRKLDHIAIGVDSPVFPDIGFHAESNFHYEETEGMNKEEEKEEVAETHSEPQKVITFSKEQFDELISTLRPPPPSETPSIDGLDPKGQDLSDGGSDAIGGEQETVEPPEEEPTAPQPKPKVEPERIFSKDTGTEASDDGLFVKESGSRKVYSRVAGLDKEKQ